MPSTVSGGTDNSVYICTLLASYLRPWASAYRTQMLSSFLKVALEGLSNTITNFVGIFIEFSIEDPTMALLSFSISPCTRRLSV